MKTVMSDWEIKDHEPSGRWGEAFPIGNGRMGAMVYGGAASDRIDLSEETFFSGRGDDEHYQIGADRAFYKMRGQIQAGKYEEALEEAAGFIGVRGNYGTNLPVGQLKIRYNYENDDRLIQGYERSLDIREGIVRTVFRAGRQTIQRQVYLSFVRQALFYRCEAENGTFTAEIAFDSGREEDGAEYENGTVRFICRARETLHSDGTCGVTLYGYGEVISDGTVTVSEGGLRVADGTWFLLCLKTETDFERADRTTETCAEELAGRVAGLLQIPACLLEEEHRADIREKMDRVSFELVGEDEKLPFLFQYGRYLLLCSSRENSRLPAHLQGIWNDNVACRIGWTCDMHLDINTQMNYWPSENSGLSEVNRPLFRWIQNKLVPAGRENARKSYGLTGWASELVSNQYGFSAPYWAESLAPCPTGGVWILTHLWEHYLYTEDREFLRQEAFPVIEEAAVFFADYVFVDADSGYWLGGPAISPENSFLVRGRRMQMSNGCTAELVLIRELFQIYIKACDLLDIHDPLYEKVKERLIGLVPYELDEEGAVKEWRHGYPAEDPQHRHTSHLLGVFPFAQITPEEERLAAAAEKTVSRKLNPPEHWEDTGWARALLILYEARLRHPVKAYGHIKSILDKLLEPNGMIIHPPTRGAGAFDNVYELDGNTGLTAGIAEMLLQSHNGVIRVLPCLPIEWRRGRISGLRARGKVETEIQWDAQKTEVRLMSGQDGEWIVFIGEEQRKVYLEAGKPLILLKS